MVETAVKSPVAEGSVFRAVVGEGPAESSFIKRLNGSEIRRGKFDVVDFAILSHFESLIVIELDDLL